MDPVGLKRNYGKDLVLHGGISAVLWDNMDAITTEMRKVVPVLKESGGCIFSSESFRSAERQS
jgi:uroporphyrinogen decarboxylase